MSMGSIRKGSDLCLSCSNALFKTWMAASTDQAVFCQGGSGVSRCIKAASRLMLLYWLILTLFNSIQFYSGETRLIPSKSADRGLHEGPTFQAQLGAGAAGADVIIVIHVDIKDQLTFQGFVCLGRARVGPMVVKQRGCVGFKTYSSLEGAILDWRVEDWGQSHLRMKLNWVTTLWRSQWALSCKEKLCANPWISYAPEAAGIGTIKNWKKRHPPIDLLKSLTFSILGTNLTYGLECFWKSEPSSTSHDSHEAKRSYVLWDQVVLRWCMWKHRPDLHTNRLALQHFCLVLLPDLPKQVLDLHKARPQQRTLISRFSSFRSRSMDFPLLLSPVVEVTEYSEWFAQLSPPCPWNTGTCRRYPERRWDALGRIWTLGLHETCRRPKKTNPSGALQNEGELPALEEIFLNSLAGTLGVVAIAQPPGTTNFGKSTFMAWRNLNHFANLKSSATNLLFLLGHFWGDGFNMFQHVSTTSRDQDMKLASTVLALPHLNICRNGKNFSLVSTSGWRWMAAADLSNVRNWMSAVSKRRSQWRWNTWRNDPGKWWAWDVWSKLSPKLGWFNSKHDCSLLRKRYTSGMLKTIEPNWLSKLRSRSSAALVPAHLGI